MTLDSQQVMRKNVLSLGEFIEEIEPLLGPFPDEPYFSLVLGAGASRSAGIPTASEMVALLEVIVNWRGFPVDAVDPAKPTLSELIATIGEYTDEDEVQAFIVRCIRRGSREPNLAHLLAANLACCGVFRPLVTTNFDDLTLAAFWQLPANEFYQEPHVIYDPGSVRLSRVRLDQQVPVIIKAHGHHTQYGLGLLDHQLELLAPGVKRAMRWLAAPQHGYLVVGMSGSFRDGVIAALADKRITKGRPIYWTVKGEFSEPARKSPLADLSRKADVRFVRCDDADELLLAMWYLLEPNKSLLLPSELFTGLTVTDQLELTDQTPDGEWAFRPSPDVGPQPSDSELRTAFGIPALREALVPVLDRIDQWDDRLLLLDCAPPSLRDRVPESVDVHFDGPDPVELEQLRTLVTRNLPWTRRNRCLLRLALSERVDAGVAYKLLSVIDGVRTGARSSP
jgi:hypothetical protein